MAQPSPVHPDARPFSTSQTPVLIRRTGSSSSSIPLSDGTLIETATRVTCSELDTFLCADTPAVEHVGCHGTEHSYLQEQARITCLGSKFHNMFPSSYGAPQMWDEKKDTRVSPPVLPCFHELILSLPVEDRNISDPWIIMHSPFGTDYYSQRNDSTTMADSFDSYPPYVRSPSSDQRSAAGSHPRCCTHSEKSSPRGPSPTPQDRLCSSHVKEARLQHPIMLKVRVRGHKVFRRFYLCSSECTLATLCAKLTNRLADIEPDDADGFDEIVALPSMPIRSDSEVKGLSNGSKLEVQWKYSTT